MATAIIRKRFYNAKSLVTSDMCAYMQVDTELPPAPFVGMRIQIGRHIHELDEITWDAVEQSFYCTAKPAFHDPTSFDSLTFDQQIKAYQDDGWWVLGLDDNKDFEPPEESITKDEEDREWDEIQSSYGRLTEAGKIEFHRRYDRALLVGRIAAEQQEKKELLDCERRQQLAVSTIYTKSRRAKLFVWVLIALYALYSFASPESKFAVNWLFLALFLLGVVILKRVNDDANQRKLSEIGLLEANYDLLRVEWFMLTGVRLDVEIQMKSMRDRWGADTEEPDKYYRRVRLGILKNLHAINDSTPSPWD